MKHIQQAGMNHASPFYGGDYILPHKEKALKSLNFRAFSLFAFLKRRCVRDSNISRNPFCTNILFNQVFKVQRLIQREEFAVLLSFDRLIGTMQRYK